MSDELKQMEARALAAELAVAEASKRWQVPVNGSWISPMADILSSLDLTAERDTLAAQVVQLREELTSTTQHARECQSMYGISGDAIIECAEKVLALTPTAAEAQAKEWREKAELLDYVAGLRSEWAGWRSPNGTWSFVPNVDYGDDFTYSASSLDDSLRAARKEASDVSAQ